LSPNTIKWYLDSQLATQELELEFHSVQMMEELPYKELFFKNTWNSSNIQIPLVVWKGKEQRLNTSLSYCETTFDFFLLF